MVRKLVAMGGAAALLLGTAVPVLAWWDLDSLDVAWVQYNAAGAAANTGGNVQVNDAYVGGDEAEVEDSQVSGSNSMTTGDADASANAAVVANTHVGCGCEEEDDHLDLAVVGQNVALAEANTGVNTQVNAVAVGDYEDDAEVEDSTISGSNSLTTGNASANARAFVLVNTHVDGLSW